MAAPVSSRPSHERLQVAREAGLGRISWFSVLAGVLSAFGAFAVLAAVAGSILDAADVDTDITTDAWDGGGFASAMLMAALLLVAYLFGGYVAGRMARRSGLLNGVLTFGVGVLAGAVGVSAVAWLGDQEAIGDDLSSIGLPTSLDEWGAVSITAALVGVGAMLVGAAVGGRLGERWHTKLAKRAADPAYGPEADARREEERRQREEAERAERERREVVDTSGLVVHEHEAPAHPDQGEREGEHREAEHQPTGTPRPF